MNIRDLSELIQKRRSIYPKRYVAQPVSKEIIEQLLENARWAPTHKLTEPWRFQVFHSEESRQALGEYLWNYYREKTPAAEFSEEKMAKMRENPLRAGAVLAIIMQRDPEERLPEFEEIAAVAMAVQNMWLSCTVLGLGSYWSSPKAILEADAFLNLSAGQLCLGLFYLGWHDMPDIEGKRSGMEEKTIWR